MLKIGKGRNSVKVAIVAGLLTSFFWAFQHPLQHPLYSTIGTNFNGILECILLAEIMAIPVFLLPLFINRKVRLAIPRVFKVKHWKSKILFAAIISSTGLLLYANGQSKINGTQISILITISPAFVLIYSYFIENEGKPSLSAMKQALVSNDFKIHILLAIIVSTSTIIGSGNYSFSNDILSSIGILLVPAFYFGNTFYISVAFKGKIHFRLAAICLSSVVSSVLASVLCVVLIVARGHNISFYQEDKEIIILFLIGGIFADFCGALVHHYTLTKKQKVRDFSALFYHTTPFFALVIALLSSLFIHTELVSVNNYHFVSIVIIVIILFLYNWRKIRSGIG